MQQNGQIHVQQAAAAAAGCHLHPVKTIHSAVQLHLYTELRNWLIAEAIVPLALRYAPLCLCVCCRLLL